MIPVASDAGNAGDGSHRHSAAAVALQADTDTNSRRPRPRHSLAQVDDSFSRKAGDPGHARRRKLEDALAKGLPAERASRDEIPIFLALGQHDMEQAERER